MKNYSEEDICKDVEESKYSKSQAECQILIRMPEEPIRVSFRLIVNLLVSSRA